MAEDRDIEIEKRLTRIETELNFYGKLVGIAVSLSGIAVTLIIAFGTHLI